MRFVIEARIVGEESAEKPILLAEFDRMDGPLDPELLGMTLQEGRALLKQAQQSFAQAYVSRWIRRRSRCDRCGSAYSHKDMRSVVYRTLYGRVDLPSPRWLECLCKCDFYGCQPTWSPLTTALPHRTSPSLEEIQVKFAAHLPYAQAVALLKEILPVDACISTGGTKNRVRAVAEDLDDCAAKAIERLRKPRELAHPSPMVTSVAVDSVWLRHCDRTRSYARQVSIAAARATLRDGTTKLCGYVTKLVPRGSKRMDQFLCGLGVKPNERVTALSDGAVEFETAIAESQYTDLRIVDWFHIAMKFRAAELTAQGMSEQMPGHWRAITMRLQRAKWNLWHGRANAAIQLLSSMPSAVEWCCPVDSSTLRRNSPQLRRLARVYPECSPRLH